MAEPEKKEPVIKKIYGTINLTLENCLLPADKLEVTPSELDGLDRETETDLRILGCELIQTAGILLKLPQVAMASGQVLFQRFFYSKSFVRHSMEATAMSCICLASKIEEAPRRIRDVINVFNNIKQIRLQKPITSVNLDQNYINLKNQVIKAERRVLKELGFCVHVKHPHKLIVMYLKYLDLEKNQQMMQIAWNYMNDSFRTDVFVRYQPETIACACIYLTARKLHICMPNNPPWFGVFKVLEDDLIDVCYRICELYRRPKPNVEKLEQAVEDLKIKYQEQRKKERRSANTSPSVTIVDRSNGSQHNAWGGFISRALPPTTGAQASNAKTVAKTDNERNNNSRSNSRKSVSKSRSRSRSNGSNYRSRSRSHSPNDKNYSRSKKKRDRYRSRSKHKRNHSHSPSSESSPSHEKRKKRDKKYSKRGASPKYFSDRNRSTGDRGGERYSNGGSRKNYSDRDKDYERSRGGDYYEKDKYSSSSKHDRYERSRNGNGHRHIDKSRDRRRN